MGWLEETGGVGADLIERTEDVSVGTLVPDQIQRTLKALEDVEGNPAMYDPRLLTNQDTPDDFSNRNKDGCRRYGDWDLNTDLYS